MTPPDLIDDLKSRINPAYASQIGTESYERRLCVEALEALIAERDDLLTALRTVAPNALGIYRQIGLEALDKLSKAASRRAAAEIKA